MSAVGENESVAEVAKRNWLSEMQCMGLYNALLKKERNPVRRTVIQKLAQAEQRHVQIWGDLIKATGEENPPTEKIPEFVDRMLAGEPSDVIHRIEAEERQDVAEYTRQLREIDDEKLNAALREIIPDEHAHALILRRLNSQADPRSALNRLLRRERQGTAGWIGDAVYGVNDGLGAIFGIVSGVSGATLGASKVVLLAGIAGMVASALSMGAGAYLASKSERELYEAELFHEKAELENHPQDAKEEMSLFYQLKGVPEDEADKITEKLASSPDQFIKAMAAEKLNATEESLSNPFFSAFVGSASTAIGAFIPIIPFFFVGGYEGVILAAVISICAHFAVGAAKSLVTVRSWWASGLEMTLVGVLEGAITYGIGLALGRFTSVGMG